MTPLDEARLNEARSYIGVQAKNPSRLSANPAARSHIAGVLVNEWMGAHNSALRARTARYFDSLVFTAEAEISLLRELGLASEIPPQPGDICMISIDGRYHWCIIEYVIGYRIYTIEFNTDEVRDEYKVWRKPGGWPLEKISYILRP